MNRASSPRRVIDASAFLGMHSDREPVRERSRRFFALYFDDVVYMNYEQVGVCDDVIWRFPRRQQDAYYPFMDRLHSAMSIIKFGYSYREIDLVTRDARLRALPPHKALLVAQVLAVDGRLYTHDAQLLALNWMADILGRFPDDSPPFNPEIAHLYRASSAISIKDIEASLCRSSFPW